MTRRHLVMCQACARHFRVNEATCPFCGAELPASLRESAPPQGPSVRLSRAALLAFSALGTGAVAAAPACGGDVAKDAKDAKDASFIAPYGIAPVPDASDQAIDASMSAAPHYGIAPVSDASASEPGDATGEADAADAHAPEDSEAPDVRVVIATPYGLPPVPPH